MSSFNPKPKDFKWADAADANVEEPIDALKSDGWQYADVPTASNFNWLLKELGKWNKYTITRVDENSDNFLTLIGYLNETRRDLRIMAGAMQAMAEKMHREHPPYLTVRLPDFKEIVPGRGVMIKQLT